ncbi:acyl-CoA dehydrogenase family protein [Flammeovirga kamogawensis]|uniref:Acyl-CoA dehydrogenase family protein n=1 Tax=Flammeovirga kamogawensis TaxID=373891 RepID=A0ABX8GUB9_9BACT|nr:acyl-CoA dehydrogenase family protein [Flammeovirga kamogawensis]MBB6463005.1 alkylation response protein AidB-like acyl-CoA dehydrogenase [Flammeovirga kamogawensis]QWG06530.1 acyl-CoA dehydrogenase family protein [Flammeovirga kamogawensis]TRX68358.1 acyl-CoA dehydrogenase [Flammeovirga kamogawensis]
MIQESIETQKMIAESVKQFGEKNIAPYRDQWDDDEHFPIEVFHQLGELGLMGILVPEEYGGTGLGYHEYVEAISGLAYFDPGIALSMAAHNSLCTNHILMFGTEEQKQRWLPKLASGEWIGAWGLTEPNTGSDAGNMLTVAHKDGDEWILNGSKNFITHGKSGNVAVVMARTGDKGDKHAMTAFVVERGTPGFSGGRKERKLGMRTSETTEMIFQDCRVSEANILGEVGEGFVQALKILDGGRISIAALGYGIAKGALKCALEYSQERKQFGKSISSFQGISFKLADMATQVEASRLLIKESIIKKERGENINKASAMAKYYASEVAVKCADEAVQIFGGYGFTKDYPVEKYYRDAKLCTIGEGTSNIQKLVISRCLLDE